MVRHVVGDADGAGRVVQRADAEAVGQVVQVGTRLRAGLVGEDMRLERQGLRGHGRGGLGGGGGEEEDEGRGGGQGWRDVHG